MNSKVHYRLWVSLSTIAIGSLVLLGATSLALADAGANSDKSQKCADKSGCQMCRMKMPHMEMMAKLRDVLAQAKDTAQAEGAKKTLAKIAEAQKLLDQEHKDMHEQMAKHMKKMHEGQAVKCPMCSKMMGTFKMKVELHCHTARYSHTALDDPNQMVPPARLVQAMITAGYDAMYITEHDVVWPDDELAQLQAAVPQIKIFPGVELNICNNKYHLLVLGTNDPQYTLMKNEGDVVEKAHAEGHLTVLAHPWMYAEGAEKLWSGPLPDAMEGLSNKGGGRISDQEIVKAITRWPVRPLVNASDVHPLSHINRFWIETNRPLVEADDIREIILAGDYTRHVAKS